MSEDFVTGSEFARWMTEESNYRTRLEARHSAQHLAVLNELSEIKGIVKEANGRTWKNSEHIAVIQREIEALKYEAGRAERRVGAVQQDVTSLRNDGPMEEWSRRKKAVIAGSLMGTGAMAWPALKSMADAVIAVMKGGS